MAKSLGQIHTANFEYTGAIASGQKVLIDTNRILTEQLQHMVRHGVYDKCVGMDLNISENGGSGGGVSVSGELRYFAPTRGRCEAFKHAFKAVRTAMKTQGINMRGNQNYDFRCSMFDLADYENGSDFINAATYDGTNELALVSSTTSNGVFNVWNANVQPAQTATPTFSKGFGVAGNTDMGDATDFVLNEGELWEGTTAPVAYGTPESIPFQIIWEPGSTNNFATGTFQFRPDPALYIAIMTGQVELVIDEIEYHDGADQVKIELAVYVAGWKSIMGNPDRRRRKSSRSSKRHGGHKK